jgi:hypothetical protein
MLVSPVYSDCHARREQRRFQGQFAEIFSLRKLNQANRSGG